MSGNRIPALSNDACVDEGTLCLQRSPLPGSVGDAAGELADLESALSLLKTEAINFGQRAIHDGPLRRKYVAEAEGIARRLWNDARAGRTTIADAAREAHHLRERLIISTRLESSDLGFAYAEKEKARLKSLPELQEHYAQKLKGQSFDSLSTAEKNRVWRNIVDASGRTRPSANTLAKHLSKAGRGFVLLSAALAVYNVATAEDKGKQAAKEGATAGAGVLGGMAGGAVAGLAFGPVGVAVGIFVGGVIAAAGADVAFEAKW